MLKQEKHSHHLEVVFTGTVFYADLIELKQVKEAEDHFCSVFDATAII